MTNTPNSPAHIGVEAPTSAGKAWPSPKNAALTYLENNFFEAEKRLTELVEKFDAQAVEYPQENLVVYLALTHRAGLSDKKYKNETTRFDAIVGPASGAISVWLSESLSKKRESTLGAVRVSFQAVKGDEIIFNVVVPLYISPLTTLSADKVSMFTGAVAQKTEFSKSLFGWASAGFALNATTVFSQKDIVSCVQASTSISGCPSTLHCTMASVTATVPAITASQCITFSAMFFFLLCVIACLMAFTASGDVLSNMIHHSLDRPNPDEKKLRLVQYVQIGSIGTGALLTLSAIFLKLFFKL